MMFNHSHLHQNPEIHYGDSKTDNDDTDDEETDE